MIFKKIILGCFFIAFAGCHPVSGPDKSFTGAVLGAGWGAGSGAVIGNQMNTTGPGALVGAGFGAASGLVTGIGLDVAEATELEQDRQIEAMQVQVQENDKALRNLQAHLDYRGRMLEANQDGVRVFFDTDLAGLRLGSVVDLEKFAESFKYNPFSGYFEVHGHSDETGDEKRNMSLSEARTRTVVNFLMQHGVSADQIRPFSHGSKYPLASNKTAAGKQLNRRVDVRLVQQ